MAETLTQQLPALLVELRTLANPLGPDRVR